MRGWYPCDCISTVQSPCQKIHTLCHFVHCPRTPIAQCFTCPYMKITGIKLYTVKSGDTGARGAAMGESQYWGGGWQAQTLISNPMSVHPAYSRIRSLWMGGGQDPFVIEIFTDDGASGFCANYGGGAFACSIIDQHLKRFLIGQDPFNIELIWD